MRGKEQFSGVCFRTGNALPFAMSLLLGYFLGSIPFGLILTRMAGLGDIREIGSGNIGATNVLRTGNKGLAALTLLLDGLKGTAAVLAARYLLPASADLSAIVPVLAGFAAFLGHIFPVWLGFKGGKGVATYIGVLLGVYWPAGVLFIAFWLITAYFTRYSSFSALLASVLAPVAMLFAQVTGGVVLLLMSALLIYKHRANIERLMAGTEPKIGQKK
jgi:acyl phosphate:glycerol-3-phosphate acyltransferase